MIKYIGFVWLCFLPLLIKAQKISVIEKYKTFERSYLNNKSTDTIYVYNFWATWCKPCIQELPYFDSLNLYSGPKPVKLVLVSLDFKAEIETTLKPFIKRNDIKNEVVVLTDENTNYWIDKIDLSWSGALPATLVISNNKRLFYEQTFHSYHDLLTHILKIEK